MPSSKINQSQPRSKYEIVAGGKLQLRKASRTLLYTNKVRVGSVYNNKHGQQLLLNGGYIPGKSGTSIVKQQKVRRSSRRRGQTTTVIEWSECKADRRYELVDRELEGTLTPREQLELRSLDRELQAHRQRVAPLPIEAAQIVLNQLQARYGTDK